MDLYWTSFGFILATRPPIKATRPIMLLNHLLSHKTDPFILASQAKLVFYATEPVDKKWSIVCFMPFRGIPNFENNVDVQSTKEHIPFTEKLLRIIRTDTYNDNNQVDYVHEGGEAIEIKQWQD